MSETPQPPKRTIDERLDALLNALTMNFELAFQEMEVFRKRTEDLDRREREGREALLAGIAAYLRALRGNQDGGNHA